MFSKRRAAIVLAASLLLLGNARLHAVRASVLDDQTDAFLTSVQLSPSDVPGRLAPSRAQFVSTTDIALQGSDDAAANLDADGFINGYEQAFRVSNQLSLLTGGPAGAGDVISVFNDAGGASAWNQYEGDNAIAFAEQVAGAQGVSVTLTDSTPLDLSGLGDEAIGAEMPGTAIIAGQNTAIVVDIALIRRDRVQYLVLVAGLVQQQRGLRSMAQALDNKVAAALPSLNGG